MKHKSIVLHPVSNSKHSKATKMPKSISVDPQNQRARGELTFPTIPIHHYRTSLSEERSIRGDATLLNILRHMLIIREFEMMLGSFKAKGNYEGIGYSYKGPAHLSIGQEGAAVGVGLALAPEDHIFGSHRSHGEFIAKGLSAITKLAEKDLLHIMETHEKGDLLRTVQRVLLSSSSVGLAENFLLFGLLAEIFMKANGFNGGMGGSMHAFFTPFGAYPNNAIVGASAGIATGAALRMKLAASKNISVALSGDGSTGCGPVFEAMNFAAMAHGPVEHPLGRIYAGVAFPCCFASTTISMPSVGKRSAKPWVGTACHASALP